MELAFNKKSRPEETFCEVDAGEVKSALSLSETHVGGMEFFPAEHAHNGRGCLLQIYPASVDAEIVRLGFGKTLIGRDASCDVVIEDTAVSRHHAVIESCQDGYAVRDLQSTNGTYVCDVRTDDEVNLTGGELIRVGGTILKFMSSMAEEVQYHAVVRELMTRDPLTSTYNRSYLIPMLQKCLERAGESDKSLALIMMDIDHFKSINDQHGHVVGDEILRVFSERIRSRLPEKSILARLGGEEFLVVADGLDLQEAAAAADDFRLAVNSTPFQTQAGKVDVTCSFGVACSENARPKTVDAFLSAVDAVLYSAKNQGRDRVALCTDTPSPAESPGHALNPGASSPAASPQPSDSHVGYKTHRG